MTCILSEWNLPPRPSQVSSPSDMESRTSVSAFPGADRVSVVRGIESPLRIARTPVERNHAELGVTAAAVEPTPVEEGESFSWRRSARASRADQSERQTGHDRVVAVRPLVERDDLSRTRACTPADSDRAGIGCMNAKSWL